MPVAGLLFLFHSFPIFILILIAIELISFSTFGLKIIKEWNAELQERTGKFRKQASAIAEWDRRILQNRDVLLRLEVLYYLVR